MINLENLEREYFYFDKPVKYKINKTTNLFIHPITLQDSEIFLSSIDIFNVDKNSSSSVEIIQMSYLKFLATILLVDNPVNRQKLINLLILCLDFKTPCFTENEQGKFGLYDSEKNIFITEKQFDEIRKIILHQNLLHYDDTYVNPDVKKAMMEMDEMKTKSLDMPTLERKIAIISSHTGILKKHQLEMTYRSHELLFEEVCGEVEYTTIRPIALFSGKDSEIDKWIYRKKKNKYDNYFTSADQYSRAMGGDGSIRQVTSSARGDMLDKQFELFTK